jgi:hypothetical protein
VPVPRSGVSGLGGSSGGGSSAERDRSFAFTLLVVVEVPLCSDCPLARLRGSSEDSFVVEFVCR